MYQYVSVSRRMSRRDSSLFRTSETPQVSLTATDYREVQFYAPRFPGLKLYTLYEAGLSFHLMPLILVSSPSEYGAYSFPVLPLQWTAFLNSFPRAIIPHVRRQCCMTSLQSTRLVAHSLTILGRLLPFGYSCTPMV